MSSWSPTKHKTKNWPSYNTALKQRGSLSIWVDAEMEWHAPATGKRGHQRELSYPRKSARCDRDKLVHLQRNMYEPERANISAEGLIS